ncbi:YdeI/OmpD-associated family protein [Arthrospiribacter ruber]|uniref:Bacteriocin-protection, YdeI or OmpD-Associated n=1 Tax=Arthrospiribacter ruber TaxID=2487934 RepID=A0A951IYE8_9BACT|nr:YdeI/OmpD-associated family protein [Arthrospiribacter ruber]MBW3468569.1 hypothetical protein [Arthrospiribacter ruber]
MHQFETTLENFNSALWHYHVPVPDDIASQLIEGTNRRILFSIAGSEYQHAALMKTKEYWFFLLNKKQCEKLSISERDKIRVTLEKDRSEFGHEVPEEFQTMLDQDQEGAEYFNSLTKGKQRSLIYLVGKVKNPDSRINKSLAILAHLKESRGNLDFKKLNEKIKYFNNLGK